MIDPDDALVFLNSPDRIGSEVVRAWNVGQGQILADVGGDDGVDGNLIVGISRVPMIGLTSWVSGRSPLKSATVPTQPGADRRASALGRT